MIIAHLSRPLSLALSIFALALGAGCSDGGAAGSGGAGGAPATPGSDLDGTWQTPCWNKTRTTITYEKLALTGTFTEYGEDACTTPIHVSEWAGAATVAGPTSDGDTKIDIAFTSLKSTPLTGDNAAFNNANQYCGATDWAANVEKDVLGKTCYGFSIPVGGKSLDIYRVEGDTLKFGAGAKIATDLTEADRPTMIDDARVFTRE